MDVDSKQGSTRKTYENGVLLCGAHEQRRAGEESARREEDGRLQEDGGDREEGDARTRAVSAHERCPQRCRQVAARRGHSTKTDAHTITMTSAYCSLQCTVMATSLLTYRKMQRSI